MAMRNLANCAKVVERAQQTRQFGVSTGRTWDDATKISSSKLHVTAQTSYPVAATLPLPANIDPSETTRFSPQRNRDISAHAILTHYQYCDIIETPLDITLDNSMTSADPHVESYDCSGVVSLNSSMQSNVPSPFGGMHKFTHLNMPGGQWSQDSKFMSQYLQSSHYTNLRKEARAGWSDYDENAIAVAKPGTHGVYSRTIAYQKLLSCGNKKLSNLHELTRKFSTNAGPDSSKASDSSATPTNKKMDKLDASTQQQDSGSEKPLSRKDKLKQAVRDYGATVIVFHVGISLISLGVCYLLVSGGIDVATLIEKVGLSATLQNTVAAGASTFVIAYAIHKVFAPVRISITLAATPLIVRYLRSKGILKVKKQ